MANAGVVTTAARCDEGVRRMQIKLNVVRDRMHGTWPYLEPDGLMGPLTRTAIDGFKSTKGISSNSPNWLHQLEQEYQRVPMLRAATSSMTVQKQSSLSLMQVVNSLGPKLASSFQNLVSAIGRDYQYAMSFRQPDAQTVRKFYFSAVGSFNAEFKSIKASYWAFKGQLSKVVPDPRKGEQWKTDSWLLRQAQSKSDKARMTARAYEDSMIRKSKELADRLRKMDVTKKIDSIVNKKGLKPISQMGPMKSLHLEKMKFSCLPILQVWSCKDIILLWIQFDKWGTEEWDRAFDRALDEYIEGFITGVLASLAVAGVVAAAGGSLPVVAVIAIFIVASIIIGLIADLIEYILEQNDIEVSFSAFIHNNVRKAANYVSSR